jgi:hypothetical protein
MKKKNLKSLTLSKKTIASFQSTKLTGGDRATDVCTPFCTMGECPPPVDTYTCDQCDIEPTLDEGSECNCL